MKKKLISAVITTYKRMPDMITRAINSVLNQTYANLELIVVDDSPADYPFRVAVKEMVEGIDDDRVKYIQHETNQGACAARNTGINAAKGDFIAFLDDDDEWLPDKLEKQMTKMSDKSVGLVYSGSLQYCTATGVEKHNECKCISGMIFDSLIRTNFVGSTSFPLIRRECFDKCGGFDVLMESSQDYELWLRISKEFKIDFIDECLVRYYIHEGEQITSSPVKKINGIERINYLYSDYFKEHKDILGRRYAELATHYARNNQRLKGLRYFLKGVCLNPQETHYNYRQLKNYVRAFITRSEK